VTAPELWGGLECTVNRVGDRYRDQVRLSGHHDRMEDLDLFATLGMKAIRYPVLWERTEIDGHLDWTWPDERLGRLRSLAIRPIVGLVHHGSGPPHTHLLDDGFAEGLGLYAGEVARRYDWVEEWTPVNEPVTTARFTALYGHWYPHAADARSFWRALLNQVDATRAAMSAIRRVNPAAKLIQTDDLGHTYATAPLAHQAMHDNLRRWAGWDLLFGRIDHHHPLFGTLDRMGFGDRLRRIADDPCPPDVVGVNHYLTSDRFLDHRLDRYPVHLHGGNGRETYADTETVRVLDPAPAGLTTAITEAWQRYRTPIAVTEVHNGSTREEQLRWAAQVWDCAHDLTAKGADIRAVTAWSLLGSRGWNTLLTQDGIYEPGLFDVSAGAPRPTALATLWRDLAQRAPRHPVADEPGWWQRPERLLYAEARASVSTTAPSGRPLLICGAGGMIGSGFVRACEARGIAHVAADRTLVDVADPATIAAALREWDPWGVVNAAGWAGIDAAERAEAACRRINAFGAGFLARACATAGIPCLNLSSDHVFAGGASRHRVESDPPRPSGAYGRSKATMEATCAALPGSLIVRTAGVFSSDHSDDFAARVLAAGAAGRRFRAAKDHYVTPTFLPSLVDEALDLLIDGAEGIWHISAGEAVAWSEFATRIAIACGHDPGLVQPVTASALHWQARRPKFAPLASERRHVPPALDYAIATFAVAQKERSRLTYGREGGAEQRF
jgi:dTDP-4-dehydrorhamnose reductase